MNDDLNDDLIEEKKSDIINQNNDIKEETNKVIKKIKGDTSLTKSKKVLKEAIDWFVSIALAIIVALLVTRFVIFKAEIPSGSMKNTIMINDRVIGWRLFSEIERGDIVIFPALKYSGEDCYYVKRIIGLPGETVAIHDGAVYIDSVKLEEDYILEKINGDFGPYVVPDNCYFALGDNRNESKDARYWENQYLEEDDIVAKVIFRFYPSFKIYKKPEYNL